MKLPIRAHIHIQRQVPNCNRPNKQTSKGTRVYITLALSVQKSSSLSIHCCTLLIFCDLMHALGSIYHLPFFFSYSYVGYLMQSLAHSLWQGNCPKFFHYLLLISTSMVETSVRDQYIWILFGLVEGTKKE